MLDNLIVYYLEEMGREPEAVYIGIKEAITLSGYEYPPVQGISLMGVFKGIGVYVINSNSLIGVGAKLGNPNLQTG